MIIKDTLINEDNLPDNMSALKYYLNAKLYEKNPFNAEYCIGDSSFLMEIPDRVLDSIDINTWKREEATEDEIRLFNKLHKLSRI